MNESQEKAKKLYASLHGHMVTPCLEQDDIAKIAAALEAEFVAGMMHVRVERKYVSVHGTDGCMNCDTGRITIYAGSRYCLECQHKKENA